MFRILDHLKVQVFFFFEKNWIHNPAPAEFASV